MSLCDSMWCPCQAPVGVTFGEKIHIPRVTPLHLVLHHRRGGLVVMQAGDVVELVTFYRKHWVIFLVLRRRKVPYGMSERMVRMVIRLLSREQTWQGYWSKVTGVLCPSPTRMGRCWRMPGARGAGLLCVTPLFSILRRQLSVRHRDRVLGPSQSCHLNSELGQE